MWGRWTSLLSEREGGTTLALYRMAMGLVSFYTVGTVLWNGLVPTLWMDFEDGGYRQNKGGSWLVDLLGGLEPPVVWGVVAASMISSVLVALGLGSRWMVLFCLWTTMALTDINTQAAGSYDEVLSNGLWLLFLADSTATLSLDCRLRTGRWTSDAQVLKFPRWLVIYQLVLMYCTTGLQKVSIHWVPGGDLDALYYIIQQPDWARFSNTRWVAHIYPLTQLATLSVWLFEVGAPILLLLLWWRRTADRGGRLRGLANRLRLRDGWALFGLGMHFGIWSLMEVGPFSYVSAAQYICLFGALEWERRLRLDRPAP